MKPFHIYGPVYYVGDSWVCIHLIDTGDGLLLLDSGNCGATAMLIQAIWSLGFRPDDVKWVILPHAHLDHIGSAEFFRKMFGSRLYIGEPDAVMMREHPEMVIIQDNPDLSVHLFEPDEVLREGDIKKFGNITMEFHLVPGHTPGVIGLFFDAEEDGVVKRCGYIGGFGLNTLQTKFLRDIGDEKLETRQIYIESMTRMQQQKVDIFLGNHTGNNQLIKKAEHIYKGDPGNPFIDDKEWFIYLGQMKIDCASLGTV